MGSDCLVAIFLCLGFPSVFRANPRSPAQRPGRLAVGLLSPLEGPLVLPWSQSDCKPRTCVPLAFTSFEPLASLSLVSCAWLDRITNPHTTTTLFFFFQKMTSFPPGRALGGACCYSPHLAEKEAGSELRDADMVLDASPRPLNCYLVISALCACSPTRKAG